MLVLTNTMKKKTNLVQILGKEKTPPPNLAQKSHLSTQL